MRMIRHSQASTLSPSRLGTVRRALMPNSTQTWLRMGPRANRVAQSRPPPRHRLRRKRMTVPQRKRKRKEERNFSTGVQHSLMRHPKNLSKIHEQISGGRLLGNLSPRRPFLNLQLWKKSGTLLKFFLRFRG